MCSICRNLVVSILCGVFAASAGADSVGPDGQPAGSAPRFADFLLDPAGPSACTPAEARRLEADESLSDLIAPVFSGAGIKSSGAAVGRSDRAGSSADWVSDSEVPRPPLLKEPGPPVWIQIGPALKPGKAFAGPPADLPEVNPRGPAYGLGRGPGADDAFVAVPLPMAAWGGLVLFGALGLSRCRRFRPAVADPQVR